MHQETAERQRLHNDDQRLANWKRWGPYLPDRQWGTVREDYSPDGTCWDYFSHDHARMRAYRWGEDGLLGFTDRQCRLCMAPSFWNKQDPILKERLYGLTGSEGNHGEDVKECYYHLASTPTHSYSQALYKYPQAAFPYEDLVAGNRSRNRHELEYELEDTGVFDEGRYFDCLVTYAKVAEDDIVMRIEVSNRAKVPADIVIVPQLWFRNTWSWGCRHEGCGLKPILRREGKGVFGQHESLGECAAWARVDGASIDHVIFTENETNTQQLWGTETYTPYTKDGFHRYLVQNERSAVNPELRGTKVGFVVDKTLAAGETTVVELRVQVGASAHAAQGEWADCEDVFSLRQDEYQEFYNTVIPAHLSAEQRLVMEQAYAGLLWSKKFYHYIVEDWLDGDADQPTPPAERLAGRNADWRHLYNRDVISMPDAWEYPWYAAWDLAFHMLPFADIDPAFAKEQLVLFLREWYMHPNGQIPAYEFAFGDVNPPVHAWACWQIFLAEGKQDRLFLARTFQKLSLNFTWWVNRKDPEGHNLFAGGFLGLDNIGVFDRSKPLPGNAQLRQADGTAWMGFFCGSLLNMSLELAKEDRAYGDMASKYFEHFVRIIEALNNAGGTGLWDEVDGFYYDQLVNEHGAIPMKVRSLVGLIPLIAVSVFDEQDLIQAPGFYKRLQWFLNNTPELSEHVQFTNGAVGERKVMLSAVPGVRLCHLINYLLDETEFLSDYGIRSMSRHHAENPYVWYSEGEEHRVDYTPGESTTWLFGGNSNWRGPIWFPIAWLLIESLETYHEFYGEALLVVVPSENPKEITLKQAAALLKERMTKLFLPNEYGARPIHGTNKLYADDPHWKDLVLFYEYFHGDSGRGCGASHQTGWTALVTRCF